MSIGLQILWSVSVSNDQYSVKPVFTLGAHYDVDRAVLTRDWTFRGSYYLVFTSLIKTKLNLFQLKYTGASLYECEKSTIAFNIFILNSQWLYSYPWADPAFIKLEMVAYCLKSKLLLKHTVSKYTVHVLAMLREYQW